MRGGAATPSTTRRSPRPTHELLVGPDELPWRRRLRLELDNVRAAVFWALDARLGRRPRAGDPHRRQPRDRDDARSTVRLRVVGGAGVAVRSATRHWAGERPCSPRRRSLRTTAATSTWRGHAPRRTRSGAACRRTARRPSWCTWSTPSSRCRRAVTRRPRRVVTACARGTHEPRRALRTGQPPSVRSFILSAVMRRGRPGPARRRRGARDLPASRQPVATRHRAHRHSAPRGVTATRAARAARLEESLHLVGQGASDVNLALTCQELARLRLGDGDLVGALPGSLDRSRPQPRQR